jgi:hypothetical protein
MIKNFITGAKYIMAPFATGFALVYFFGINSLFALLSALLVIAACVLVGMMINDPL